MEANEKYDVTVRVHYLVDGVPQVWTSQGNHGRAKAMVDFLDLYDVFPSRRFEPLYSLVPR